MSGHKILHISDLHVSEKTPSVLQNDKYLDPLFTKFSELGEFCALVISGDIVDRGGSQKDYEIARDIIEKIKKESDATHVIVVPGNHDVSRDRLTGCRGDRDIDEKQLWQYTDIKFSYFSEFLENMNLDADIKSGLIMYKIINDPRIIILGIDSTYHIGTTDAGGYINIETLQRSLEQIFECDNERYKEYTKIAVLHHTPIVYHSASQTYADNNGTGVGQYGTCDPENWKSVKNLLLKYDVHLVLAGHVHGTQSERIQEFEQPNDGIFYSIAGSIGVNFNNEVKDLSGIDEKYKRKLDNLQCYVSLNGNHNSFDVISIEDKDYIIEEQYKYVMDEGIGKWILWSKKPNKDKEEDDIFAEPVDVVEPMPSKSQYTDAILRMVRENKLYKTGHFHWKGYALHNWIDVSYFFQHQTAILTVVQGIRFIIEREIKISNPEYIIGLGVKGSVIMSYVRYLFPESKCSYYPESKKEYNKYELKLFDGKGLNSPIILLTDVVHSGNTIKSFIDDNYAPRQRACINVITIFDTYPAREISSIDDYRDIKLYSLAQIQVTECKGGMSRCPVYSSKLAYVYEYEEDKKEDF